MSRRRRGHAEIHWDEGRPKSHLKDNICPNATYNKAVPEPNPMFEFNFMQIELSRTSAPKLCVEAFYDKDAHLFVRGSYAPPKVVCKIQRGPT